VATASGIGSAFYAFALILLPTLAFVGLVTFERAALGQPRVRVAESDRGGARASRAPQPPAADLSLLAPGRGGQGSALGGGPGAAGALC
jgi:hypothetical protein